MQSNVRSLLTFFLGWPLSLVALFFLAKTFITQFSFIKANLAHIEWIQLCLGLVLFTAYFYLRSFIWYRLLRLRGFELDVRESLFHWSFGQLKRYIPGNIWGVLGVSVHFSKKNVSNKEIASSFIIESQLVLLAAFFLSLFSLNLFLKSTGGFFLVEANLARLCTFIVVGALGLYCFSRALKKILRGVPKIFLYALPDLSPQQIFSLWFLMVISFISYGFGTYFTISSLVYLDVTKVFQISSYFILSLLIGFLSFVTPSGLGVREGVMVLGLTQFIPNSIAAFGALFARLLLIIGELVFIGVSFTIHKVRTGWFGKIIEWIIIHPHEIIVAIFYTSFVWYFTLISFLRYENYYTGRFDLGNMVQTVWNTLHGNIFQFTNPDGVATVSRLAFHADVILVFLTPLYALWEDPRMLLLIQVLITGAGVFFVYALSHEVLKSKSYSVVFSFLYVINPSIQRSVIYDFHAVTLATTFLLGAFYFLYKKKYGWFMIFIILAALTKEQIWAIVALFGLYITFVHRKLKFGISLFLLGSVVLYLLLWHIIPSFAGSKHFALSYYTKSSELDSPSSLIKTYLFAPGTVFEIVTSEERLDYLTKLLRPLGYLSLLAPLFLVFTIPDLTINLLSTKSELYQIYYQYTAAITPFLFISAVFGLKLLLSRVKFFSHTLVIMYLTAMGTYSGYLYGPLPGSKEPNLAMITHPAANKDALDQLLNAIPKEASVSTSNNLGSHLAERTYLFTFPHGWDDADYVIFTINENAYPSFEIHKKQIEKLKQDNRYEKYYDDGRIIAFRKISNKTSR